MKIIGFDIETIPQRDPLTRAQLEWLAPKLKNAIDRSESENEEEIKRRIMATSPFLGEIVCISLGELRDGYNVQTESFIGDEDVILNNFWRTIGKVSNALFVSFNGLKFDVNFINIRSMKYSIKPTNRYFLNTTKFRKYPHFDVMQLMSDWGYPSPSLDLACDLAGIKSSKEGEIKAKDVANAFNEGKILQIAQYCEEDVRATLEVYLKLKDYIRD